MLDVSELIRGCESSANINLPQEERPNHREKEEESILVNLAIIPVSFTGRNSCLIISYRTVRRKLLFDYVTSTPPRPVEFPSSEYADYFVY